MRQSAQGAPAWRERLSWAFRVMGILPILALVCILFWIHTDRFATMNNAINILRAASINITLAAGMTLVILTGGIDLSIGSTLAVTGVFALQLSLLPHWAPYDIVLPVLMGLAIGIANGAIIAYLELPPFIITMGTMTALRGVAQLMSDGQSVINIDLNFSWIGNESFLGLPWLGIIALVVVAIVWFVLRKTVLGERIYAVGGNVGAARLTGINVPLILIVVYGISGLLCGVAAIMTTSRLNSASGLLGNGYELDAIASVVLGGTSMAGGLGGVGGTLLGALLIAVINNGLVLMNVSYFSQLVIKGLIIIVAVILDKYRSR